MIKLENYEVVGWEHAIRGMRNPMNSWEKSDTRYCGEYDDCLGCPALDENDECRFYEVDTGIMRPIIGPNDHSLMMKLAKAGPVHAKYRRMIEVYVDITAPLYWWKEFDTYKVGTVANSCSTMHKIHEKEFTLEDFSCEHLFTTSNTSLKCTIQLLNLYRAYYVDDIEYINRQDSYQRFRNYDKKDIWWQMIQLLPSSYNQKRTIMLNYEVLANIYEYRKDHKLDEWRDMCKWIESLPYSEIITGVDVNNSDRVGTVG